ncbi:MAG: GTP-binding protein [Cellulomonas sp.]|nr:GTP-binding protein [Cellulomonas sp.]
MSLSPLTPLAVLATIDPVRRETAILSAVLDRPRTVVLRHDLRPEEDGLHRLVVDASGVVDDVVVPLEHSCVSCAVREDAVPTLARLAADGRWDAIVLALPVTADSLPVTRALAARTEPGEQLEHLRLSAAVVAVDLAGLVDDLLGDDLLDERGLAFGEEDRRSVGEALAAQLAHADVVQVASRPQDHPVASDLLDHIRAGDGSRVADGDERSDDLLFDSVHDTVRADRRTDPRRVPSAHRRSEHGVWTIALRSHRPFHPDRVLEHIERLGGGRVRSRGVFWVPTRPDSLCAWEGSGGQVSIGDLGPWGLDAPRTELVVTGIGDEDSRIRAAFTDSLLTRAELSDGLTPWLGREDVLAPWLGERGEVG